MKKKSYLEVVVFIIIAIGFFASSGFCLGPDSSITQATATFKGEYAYDYAGWSLSRAGDVNGDGFDDFIVSADTNDEGGNSSGQTYLIFGTASGWQMQTDISLAASASFIGETAESYSGRSVAGAGDVNNDGFDDIIIGAHRYADGEKERVGKTYLIFGKATGWSMDVNLSTADASFIGEAERDYSAIWVSGAGDVNGDGFDDILIGAYMNDNAGENQGNTYLILGKASGWSRNVSLSASDASFVGEVSRDGTGKCSAAAGDVNNDGFDDFLIGSTGYGNNGRTYLIFGNASADWGNNFNLAGADVKFDGERSGDGSGGTVAGAGDVNNDGYDDILIGADENDDSFPGAGKAYLVLGKQTADWSDIVNLSDADAAFVGEYEKDSLGCSVASAGDVNGDGFDDILLGATGQNSYTGKAYLIFGRETVSEFQSDMAFADASFIGKETYSYTGFIVSSAGDIDSDGYADILISAAYEDSVGYYSGSAYMILGADFITPDFDSDGDVDGLDLAVFINETNSISLPEFAAQFGKTN